MRKYAKGKKLGGNQKRSQKPEEKQQLKTQKAKKNQKT
jgi:hypothetical protein